MKKKLVPILVILALVIVGVGGYLMGQQSNNPVVENPPAQSSTPETTPTTPVVEMASPEPSVEPVADTTPQELPFNEALYSVYVKPNYIQNGNGVPVWDKYKVDTSQGINGLQKEVFKTSANAGVPYVVIGVGYGEADGYIQVLDPTTGKSGYTNENWFTQEVVEVEAQKPADQQKPVEQKPDQQTPTQQKPAQQTPTQQKPAQQEPTQQKPTDTGAGSEYYTPETSDRATIPEDQQIHDGGASGGFRDGTIGVHYTGKISG